MGLNGILPALEWNGVPASVFDSSLNSPLHEIPLRHCEPRGLGADVKLAESPEVSTYSDADMEVLGETSPHQWTSADSPKECKYVSLLSMALILNSHHDLDGLFLALKSELAKVIELDFIAVALVDPALQKVEWRTGRSGHGVQWSTVAGRREEMISRWVYEHQRPLVIPSLVKDGVSRDGSNDLTGDELRSAWAIPLTFAQKRIGSLLVGSKREGAYLRTDVGFLFSIASTVASAVNDALKFEAHRRAEADLRNEKERLRLLLEISSRVASTLEFKGLLRTVTAGVCRVMHCDAVAVHLPSRATSTLELIAIDTREGRESIDERVLHPNKRCVRHRPDEVFRSRKPMLLDATEVTSWSSDGECSVCSSASGKVVRSVCSLPLLCRGRVLGVLELVRESEPAFTQSEIDFMGQVADQIAIALENSLAHEQITALKNQLARESLCVGDERRNEHGFEEIIGRSAAIRAVLHKIETVAPTDSTVLICGETGTGKELVARAIHGRSQRHGNPFVKLNCAAIPTGLLESELFGHERGAFTGAIAQRIGRFELAHRGTAFLDEIGEVPLELQPKLLRVLQEREFERLGSARTLKTEARLIAATNRDLCQCVAEKVFRADLFYRLNVFPIHVPPLRDRREDIPILVRHFVQHYARKMEKTIDTIPSETMEALVRHRWPGNIRELQNLIEHSVIVTFGPVLKVPLAEIQASAAITPDGAKSRTLEEVERDLIVSTLKDTNWVQSGPAGAAARLGMSRSTLQSRMKRLGIVRTR